MGNKNLSEPSAEPVKEGTPTKALRSEGRSKMEKRKAEDKHLKIVLLRIPGGKQKNLRPRDAGSLPFGH
jgi:hypothetical protein